jgi:hypothetical protein
MRRRWLPGHLQPVQQPRLDSHAVLVVRYANAQTKAFVFYGTTSGVSVPELKWDSGVGKWDWNNAKFVSAAVNGDGLGDIAALYQYPYSQTKAFVFFGTSTGVRAPLLS